MFAALPTASGLGCCQFVDQPPSAIDDATMKCCRLTGGRRPRVLQVITRLGLGGAERVALSIVTALGREIDSAIFTVHPNIEDDVGQAMRNHLANMSVPWFRGTRIPMKAGGMIPGGVLLNGAVRRFAPDIIHFHSETPEACGAVFAFLNPGRRHPALIRTIHNSVFWRYWPRIGRWCDHQMACSFVSCVSEAAREEFLRYRTASGAGSSLDAPVVIYNGVDQSLLAPHTSPIDANRRRLLFAGRFEDQKGPDLLADALPGVRLPVGVKAELTFVGHGKHESALRVLANRPPPGWSVRVRPPVPHLPDLLSEFDLVVVPSRFEGLGLVAIETTLAGRPIVAADAPGLRETFPARHPWIFPPGDTNRLALALTDCLARTEAWGPAVRTAQEFAHHRFSPDAMASGYRLLYRRAVNYRDNVVRS